MDSQQGGRSLDQVLSYFSISFNPLQICTTDTSKCQVLDCPRSWNTVFWETANSPHPKRCIPNYPIQCNTTTNRYLYTCFFRVCGSSCFVYLGCDLLPLQASTPSKYFRVCSEGGIPCRPETPSTVSNLWHSNVQGWELSAEAQISREINFGVLGFCFRH